MNLIFFNLLCLGPWVLAPGDRYAASWDPPSPEEDYGHVELASQALKGAQRMPTWKAKVS